MKHTLKAQRDEIRKQIAVQEKLVYITKAPNGKIIAVSEAEWIEINFLPKLQEQAYLNKQEYEQAIKIEAQAQQELLMKRFEQIAKEHEEALERIEALEHEIAVIKGEE
jgi:hypothetical protein